MRSLIVGLALVGLTALAMPDPAGAQGRGAPRRPPAVGQRVKPNAPRAARAAKPARPARRAVLRRLRRFDSNHDGQISRDEFKGPAERFNRLDRNNDGVINKQDRVRPRRPAPTASKG